VINKPLFFLKKKYIRECIHLYLLFSQLIPYYSCLTVSLGKTEGKFAIIAKIAYDLKNSGKKITGFMLPFVLPLP